MSAGTTSATVLPRRMIDDAICELEGLVELVTDEDDRLAVGLEPVHDVDEALDLGGRQDRGRFVEDEDVRLAGEHLDDLDPLLETHREILDDGVGVDVEAVAARDLPNGLARPLQIEPAEALRRLVAEHDVLGHGEDGHEHEVLVDHPDASGDGIARSGEVLRLAVEADLPGRWACRARTGCSSACSCRRRSRRGGRGSRRLATRRLTSSLASTPGNCLVMPESSSSNSSLHGLASAAH